MSLKLVSSGLRQASSSIFKSSSKRILKPKLKNGLSLFRNASTVIRARVKKVTEFERTAPLRSFLGSNFENGEILNPSQDSLEGLLKTTDSRLVKALYTHANSVTERFFGNVVHFRGIVEFSNVCTKDCYYCGIRKHMPKVHRYTMKKDEIIETAMWAHSVKYGSVMLQSGELPTPERLDFIENLIRELKEKSIAADIARGIKDPVGLRIALSVGELSREEYKRLRDAGAHAFLLRIETSNPKLYKSLHPADHSWQRRKECISTLKGLGYQIGTGVMIGLPGQTVSDLAKDLQYFRKEEVDMLGMGPYITEPDTPLGTDINIVNSLMDQDEQLELSMRMIALARIMLGDINIAATTALQALNPTGREMALERGANIMMPILTPTKYREKYQLYAGKPCVDEDAQQCQGCLENRVRSLGKVVGYDSWGTPPSYSRRYGSR